MPSAVLKRDSAKTSAGGPCRSTLAPSRPSGGCAKCRLLAAGKAYQRGSHGGYVPGDELGAGYKTQRLRKTFYRITDGAGLRRIIFHHARHSALSYLPLTTT
jgi:hypothetical protein